MATRTDSFDRANSSSLGSDWAEDSGDWSISSNNLLQGTTGNSYRKLRWVGAAMDSNDYSVEVVARSGGQGIGPAARCAGSSAVTYYGYVIFGGDAAYLVEITAGGETVLDTGSAISTGTNYTLRLEVEGTAIRGYLNGVLDVSATDASLTSGAPGIMAYGGNDSGTYVTTWTASDLASGTTYNQSAAGSLTPSGALVRQTRKTPAGALGLAGVLARRTAKTLAGAMTLAGTTVKRTAKTLAGALGLAGARSSLRTSYIAATGALGLSGTVSRQVNKAFAGTLGLVGVLIRQTNRTLSGALGLAGDVATEFFGGVIQVAVGGALLLSGVVTRQTNKALAGTLVLAGGISRQISKLLSGALGLAGSLVRLLTGPSAFKADADLTDSAPYTAALVNVSPYTATLSNAAPYAATVTDEA